jgi:uncharacterized protein DUF998
MRRLCYLVGTFAPPLAGFTVFTTGLLTPGYDPLLRTVSRLAVPGMPYAVATDLAIALAGLACLAVAVATDRGTRAGRAALAVAAVAFLTAAMVHLDPASAVATWTHRTASGLAVLALTAAPLGLWRAYGRLLLLVGAAELGMLVTAAALLATSFWAWGAWERVMLALGLSLVVALAIRARPSIEDAPSATAAIQSSPGA